MPIMAFSGLAVASSSTGKGKDLLSRISHPSPSTLATANGRPRKRRVSDIDDDDEEKRRRRARINKPMQFDPEAPWMSRTSLTVVKQPKDAMIHDELCAFVDYISPSACERKARQLLVNCIETLLKKRWPDVHVLVFGSNATGLELTGGDIDLVVSFDSMPNFSDSSRKSRLAAMGDAVRKAGVTSWVNRIFGARVPIITFATTAELGEFSVDISVRNAEDSGARAIPLIKQYIKENPLLRPLIIAVKAFLSLRDLNDASQNTLSSYAITLLCISFLQRNPARREEHMLNNPYENKSLGTLLMDFFRHYGHDFSYATHYVSVSGKNIFTKKSNNWDLNLLSPAVLAVQCVLNSGNNITKGCTRIDEIVEAFKEGLHLLQTTPSDFPELSEDNKSVLNGLFVIPEEDQRRRETLEAAVNSGAYARAASVCSSSTPPTNLGSSGGVFLGPRGAQARHTQRNGFPRNGLSQFNIPAPPASGNSRNSNYSAAQNVVAKHTTPEVLPILRWEDNRSPNQRQRTSQHAHNRQFDFTFGQQSQPNPMMVGNFFNATVGPIFNLHNQVNRGYEYQQQQFVSNNLPSHQRRRGGNHNDLRHSM